MPVNAIPVFNLWKRVSGKYGDNYFFMSIDKRERMKRVENRLYERYWRRTIKEEKAKTINDKKPGRPIKEDKKTPISVKLPPDIIKWLDEQPESRAVLIEKGIKELQKI